MVILKNLFASLKIFLTTAINKNIFLKIYTIQEAFTMDSVYWEIFEVKNFRGGSLSRINFEDGHLVIIDSNGMMHFVS